MQALSIQYKVHAEMQGKQGNSIGVGSNISETTQYIFQNRAHKLEEFEPFRIHPTVRNKPTKHGSTKTVRSKIKVERPWVWLGVWLRPLSSFVTIVANST